MPRRLALTCPLLILVVACGGGAPNTSNPNAPESPDGPTTEGSSDESTGSSDDGTASGGGAKAPAPKKGESLHVTRKAELSFDLTLQRNGQAAGIKSESWSMEEDRMLEVVEAGGGAISKLEVAYGRLESKALLGKKVETPTSGKAYVVDASGTVKRADGGDAGNDEADAVTRDYPYVGSPSALAKGIAGAKPGDTIPGSAEAARALLGNIPGVDHEDTELTLVLKSVEGDRATVDVKAKAKLVSGKTTLTLDLSGPASIDVSTGWVASASLEGTVSATGQYEHGKQLLDVAGKGRASASVAEK